MTAGKEPFSFAKAFSELEKIVAEFERGELELDVALPKFERGLELARNLKGRLKEIENRVETIRKKFADLEEEADDSDKST